VRGDLVCGICQFLWYRNVSTMTDFKLLTVEQPADKIPENLPVGSFESERARAIQESCEILKNSTYTWVPSLNTLI